ncbi:exodeoxyribonuclease VII large subunit [Neolewinella lacunae]|uniref:Exodeoxyribonuclease 7 large subunit n=1 Tax=Neolewinella lacunae TaxID=1517758 RepID=A0A923TF16_9BACT|nr:exodeoxyribonuclease VII large subunit [Neolewinella lacunae]MBC6996522.1 exodeoxyribonuclease VII large subunit [Neolewinella lacunae]MDN3634913.1 exodeoxyribonuclease VII large subunit [Neolewinella lacunae]
MATVTYQLHELTDFIRRVFALNLPQAVWVAAELAQVNSSRGHCYFTLVQKAPEEATIQAQLDGVVWQGQWREIQRIHGPKIVRDLFQEGMSVRLKVTTSFHPRYGLKLVVEDIDPAYTVGLLEMRRQETLAKLSAAGLLDRNAQLPLPLAPQRLAVISSDAAAGLADFRQQLNANPYGYCFRTQLFTAAMQGSQASPEILSRLRQIAGWAGAFDAVVIVRGGGGKTDLAAFDAEDLAVAVAEFPLPVLVGIGHETDDTVLDRVAHRSLKTPTATAVFLVDCLARAEYRVLQLARDIHGSGERIRQRQEGMLQRTQELTFQAAHHALAQAQQLLNQVGREIPRLADRATTAEQERLGHLTRLLKALHPATTLARGYGLVSQDGHLITDPAQIKEGAVDLRLEKGRVRLRTDGPAG